MVFAVCYKTNKQTIMIFFIGFPFQQYSQYVIEFSRYSITSVLSLFDYSIVPRHF